MGKVQHDWWGTPRPLTGVIVRVMKQRGFFKIRNRRVRVIEPAAGDGAFIDALLDNGIEPENIIAFENKVNLNRQLRSKTPHVFGDFRRAPEVIAKFALESSKTSYEDDFFVTLMNPPFCNNAAVDFLRIAKQVSMRIGSLCPLGWMEPALRRKWKPTGTFASLDEGRMINGGLKTIFPIERVSFDDLAACVLEREPEVGVGGRPTNFYEYEWDKANGGGYDVRTNPIIDMSIDDEWTRVKLLSGEEMRSETGLGYRHRDSR
jgi:hypothetical protein